MDSLIDELQMKSLINEKLNLVYDISGNEANLEQIYKATVLVINDILRKKRREFSNKVKEQKAKRVYYLSMEFLMGKSLKNNISNLGLVDKVQDAIAQYGYTLEDLYEQEPDAALGNGGLGRLGACYLDGLASCDYPAMGFTLRYEYGLFKQRIIDGWQTELPDIWLPGGEVWLIKRPDKIYKVRFDGYCEEKQINGKTVIDYKGYSEIQADAYDMMVSGGDSQAVSILRLWRSRNVTNFDLNSFSQGDYIKAMKAYNDAELISKVLYPSDDHYEGKTLRLKQQYFLVSASIQNIIADHIRYYGNIRTLSKYVAIHINDTHPALCIPELVRILMDEYNFTFDEAWEMTKKTVNYTNHTVMAEALEKWNEDLIASKLPRIHLIIQQINQRFCDEARCTGISDEELAHLSIFGNGQIRMANMCVIASGKVNGVSALHSEIIKDSIFNGYYKMTPEKFTNVTNGIAYRRWLCQSNPALTNYIESLIGPGFKKDASELEKLLTYVEDDEVLNKIGEIKQRNKREFAKFLYKKTGITIDPKTRFDVQVKRLHEYKRQLLNVLKIVDLFVQLEQNPNMEMVPQTFIFGAKAASSYYLAKEIIKLICFISKEISYRSQMQEKLNVVFVEDYNVTTAENLMPASEVSQQISLAGKEASGTGNMKFMINGAITFGTLDGANVEITEQVGEDNIFLFGNKTEEVNELWARGYNPRSYYENNERIKRVLDRLDYGFAGQSFHHIKEYLINSDPYMCLADFEDYVRVHEKMNETYEDKRRWNQMSLINIAKAGIFSADRSVTEYAENIWKTKKVK